MCQVEQRAGEGQECSGSGAVSSFYFFSMKLAVSACGASVGSYFFGCCFCFYWVVACRGRVSPRRASNFLVATRKLPKKRVCRQLSGGTHYATASLRSDSRRKSEFLLEGARRLRAPGVLCHLRRIDFFDHSDSVFASFSEGLYRLTRQKHASCMLSKSSYPPSPRAEAHRAQGGQMRRRTHLHRHQAGRSCLSAALPSA